MTISHKMKKIARHLAIAMIAIAGASLPATAQQVIGFQPGVGPICTGPRGVAPCAVIQQWMAQQGAMQQQPGFGQYPGNAPGLPGAGLLPQDGQIVAGITRACGGNPVCIAGAWGSVGVSRCRQGILQPGGCFGPNGEIMKAVNRVLPQNLQPNTIVGNVQKDLTQGPGPGNEVNQIGRRLFLWR